MFSSAAYDIVKGTARKALGGGKSDEVATALAEAYERACSRFFDHYGDRFGTPNSSFLARRENAEHALRATFLGTEDLRPDALDPHGFDGAPTATLEAMHFFVDVLREEMRRERTLDRILEEKASQELLQGVDRTLREVRDSLVGPAEGGQQSGAYEGVRVPEAYVTDTVRSTLLPVSRIPMKVYAAPCSRTEDEVRELIDWSRAKGAMLPYIVRGDVLYTFTNLYKRGNPFSAAMDGSAEGHKAREWWDVPNLHRWYVELLGRTLNKLTGRKRLNLDKDHDRYYFEPLSDDEVSELDNAEGDEADVLRFREVPYRTLGGNVSSRKVAYRPQFKHSGELKPFWEHWAVSLRFHQVGPKSWCLTLRPGRRFTSDGYKQLTPKGMGKRSTKQRSKMYNIDVLNEVHFWRDFLSDGSPRIIMRFGGQSLVVENEMLSGEVRWPGVPNDAKAVKNERYEEDLFSQAKLDAALAEVAASDFWGEGEEGDDWEEEDDWDNEVWEDEDV